MNVFDAERFCLPKGKKIINSLVVEGTSMNVLEAYKELYVGHDNPYSEKYKIHVCIIFDLFFNEFSKIINFESKGQHNVCINLV